MSHGNDRELTLVATETLDAADVYFTARRFGVAVIEKSTVSGGVDVDGTAATVTIERADTIDLSAWQTHVLSWDLEVVGGADDTHTVASGQLAIQPVVTQRA
jgi:hypothetical protein